MQDFEARNTEIKAKQEARFKHSDSEAAPRHEEAVALYGIEAAAQRAKDKGVGLAVQNPWTGEGQSYEQYQDYLAQKTGAAAAAITEE